MYSHHAQSRFYKTTFNCLVATEKTYLLFVLSCNLKKTFLSLRTLFSNHRTLCATLKIFRQRPTSDYITFEKKNHMYMFSIQGVSPSVHPRITFSVFNIFGIYLRKIMYIISGIFKKMYYYLFDSQ